VQHLGKYTPNYRRSNNTRIPVGLDTTAKSEYIFYFIHTNPFHTHQQFSCTQAGSGQPERAYIGRWPPKHSSSHTTTPPKNGLLHNRSYGTLHTTHIHLSATTTKRHLLTTLRPNSRKTIGSNWINIKPENVLCTSPDVPKPLVAGLNPSWSPTVTSPPPYEAHNHSYFFAYTLLS
jgi:hypothetical protein